MATLLCFYLMYLLVSVDIKPRDHETIRISAPMRPVELRPQSREVRKKPVKVLPTVPPPGPNALPQLPRVEVTRANAVSFGSVADRFDDDVQTMRLSPPIQDLVPLVVIQPDYPFKAMIQEIEGYVVVQFTVREDGSVLNPVVVESRPGDIFDKAALKAIQQSRFQPRQAGADTLVASGVRMRFAFRLKSPYE
ncbi:MAG: TonB family protein [Pseudomonadales bacterium]|nr:TonB family protein [Pseudomonadales bacterium]